MHSALAGHRGAKGDPPQGWTGHSAATTIGPVRGLLNLISVDLAVQLVVRLIGLIIAGSLLAFVVGWFEAFAEGDFLYPFRALEGVLIVFGLFPLILPVIGAVGVGLLVLAWWRDRRR